MNKKNMQLQLPEGPVFSIEESANDMAGVDLIRTVAERFTVGSSCDARDLKAVIQSVGPREVYFTGPYAKQYARELRSSKYSVHSLYPSHLPALF